MQEKSSAMESSGRASFRETERSRRIPGRRLVAVLAVALGVIAPAAEAQGKRQGRFTEYPIKPYCTECLKRKLIEEPKRKIRLMQFEGEDVLEHIESRHVIYLEHDDFKLVSTVPGMKFNPNTSPRLSLELKMLRERFPRLKGKMPKLNRHQVAHLFALHMHRVKLEFWDMFDARASSYMGIMNRTNKHEIYLFGKQRDYDRFTDRFTGVEAKGGQEIILHQDNAVGFIRPPPPRAGLNTWNNTVTHMWVHLLLECQVKNAYNRPAWLDAGFAHWWERREHPSYNTYCYTESREVGHFGSGKWRTRIRRLVASGEAPDLAEYCEIKELSSLGNVQHGLSFGLVDYIIQHKLPALREFVRRLGAPDHVDQHATFRAAFGMSFTAFDEEWRAWVRKTYPKQ